MKKITSTILAVSLSAILLFSSCTRELGSMSVISTKTLGMKYQDNAKATMTVKGSGGNIYKAVTNALTKAGGNYDALIDCRVAVSTYYCVLFDLIVYKVQGTPVNTSQLKASLTNDQFNYWCKINKAAFPTAGN